MITDLVIDQEGGRLCLLEKGENAGEKSLLVLEHFSKSVTCKAVSDCLSGKRRGYHGLEGVTQVFSLVKHNFQCEFKEHSGEKVSVRDVPKSQWCGGGSTEGSGLSGDNATAREGRDEHQGS